jgi:hypothetical protein
MMPMSRVMGQPGHQITVTPTTKGLSILIEEDGAPAEVIIRLSRRNAVMLHSFIGWALDNPVVEGK